MKYKTHLVNVESGMHDSVWTEVSNGTWEPATFLVFDKFIDERHSYVDIGSWIGPTLLYGARNARAAYGVEPDLIAYSQLRRNVELNPALAKN